MDSYLWQHSVRTSYLANIFCWFWNHYCIASVHNSCRYQTKFCQSCSFNCWTLNRYVFQPGSRRNGGQPEGVLGLSAVGLHLNSSSQLWTVFWLIGLPPYWRVSLPYGFIFSWTFDHKKGVTGLVFFPCFLSINQSCLTCHCIHHVEKIMGSNWTKIKEMSYCTCVSHCL